MPRAPQIIDTATWVPALGDVDRSVAIAVTDRNIEAELLEAAAAEGFEALAFASFDAVLEHVAAHDTPIVVLEAEGGCSLDDLAADAHAVVTATPEGATVAYVTKDAPPANEIRAEIADWLVWPASQSHLRTKLRAWLLRRACRWRAASLPANEAERLAALWNLGILDTEPEDRFDRYTEVACDTFDVPIALVSLVDSDRQWFKSHHGIDITETHRDLSMCAHAILEDDVFVVTDALRDDRFADNPYVARGPRLRFYAGVPLTADEQCVGTLCIMDHRPRVLNEPQLERLRELGRMVEAELIAAGDESPR